jgi:putative two-component system response regulator
LTGALAVNAPEQEDGASMHGNGATGRIRVEDLRILVVDDEPSTVALLEALLDWWGHRNVVSTSDSASVEALCDEVDPDLLLLDLHMPAPDGFAIMGRLQRRIRATVSLPVLVLSGDVTATLKRRALAGGARDFLTKPFDLDEVRLRVRNLLEIRALQLAQQRQEQELEERVRARTGELEAARLEVVERLGRAGEFRDDETGEHTRRVGRTALLLAETLGLDAELARRLWLAAPLHDIGKIAIPDAVLLKPGRLTPEEFAVIQSHPTIGAKMLEGSASTLLGLAQEIALSHHERWDGGGYPRGLTGETIPLGGRIVALADVFDALTHARPYKEAWTVEDAVAEITRQRGRQFDPELVEAFLSLDHARLV